MKFGLHHWIGLGESFQTVLMTMGRKLPQGAQKRENSLLQKLENLGIPQNMKSCHDGKSDTLKVFPRPKLLADRNANLRFDLAFTVLPPNHDLCPKTPIFSAASSNFRLQTKFRLHH